MATVKIGQNELCPCGSGKKYKRCCLNKATSHMHALPSETGDSRYPAIDPAKHPDPLIHGYLKQEIYTSTFVYNPPLPTYGAEPRPEGYPGEYNVEFTLQSPSRVVMDGTEWNAGSDLPGGSLIAIAKPLPRKEHDVTGINVDIALVSTGSSQQPATLRYKFIPNADGFLSTIKVNLSAQNVADAENTAYKHLAPVLTEWAFVHDVPLDIARIRTEEVATKTCMCRFTRQAYLKVPVDTAYFRGIGTVSEQYHPLVFYREALSATNPLYQYLCFYKVVELISKLRSARVAEARKAGTEPSVISERLVRDAWLTKHIREELLNEVDNKTFNHIRDNVLRPQRHRIAHALLDDESLTDTMANSAEELLNLTSVFRLLPLVKYIARTMIMNEMGISVPNT